MSIYQLLHLLSDGKIHSGSELGERLGLSRTSIWKALSQLDNLPLELEVIKGKGYRIPGGLDLLSQEKLLVHASADIASLCKLETLLTCNSTNDYVAAKASEFTDEAYTVCFAEQQTAGRGRRGRSWISPFARNIYLSIGFKIHGGVEALSGMSLVVGLAVASALTKLGTTDCLVKWPNDVLLSGKKIAGVLIELQGEATTGWDVVCGVGLNVAMTKSQGQAIDQDWIALQERIDVARNEVAGVILNELIIYLEQFKSKGFEQFLPAWQRYDYLHGKELVISPTGVQGIGAGVNHQGALLVNVGGQEMAINAGEISVRRL